MTIASTHLDLRAPVSSIMTTSLITIEPQETMKRVKEIFDTHRIHHLPVVSEKHIIGLISKSDVLHFIRGMHQSSYDELLENVRLERYHAEDIMTTRLAKIDVDERINVAIEVFKENLFHAIPVVKNGELAGLITTFDIIRMLSDEDNQRIAALSTRHNK